MSSNQSIGSTRRNPPTPAQPSFHPNILPPFSSASLQNLPLPPAALRTSTSIIKRNKEEEDAFEVKPTSFLSNERTFLSWASFVRYRRVSVLV